MIASQKIATRSNEVLRFTFLGNQGLRTLAEVDIAKALHDLLRRADLHYSFRVALELSRSGSYSSGLIIKEAFRGGVECTWCKDDTGNSPSIQVLVYMPLGYETRIHTSKPAQDMLQRMLAAQKVLATTVENLIVEPEDSKNPTFESVLEELKKLDKIGPFGGVERDDLLLILNLKFQFDVVDAKDLLDDFVKDDQLYRESLQGYILNMKYEKYFGSIPTSKPREIKNAPVQKVATQKKKLGNGLGAKLRQFREMHGISEERLANAAGVSVLTLRSAENDYKINFKTSKMLSKGLEDWILK
jgi:DNA-binding XRE family transcriptional regulator